MSIIIAIIMIGLIVLIHEFGHFIVAKANGVAVVEFSIGFGPKLFGIKKGDTEYCLKLIPFGGACIMLGDDMLTQSDDGSEDENGEDEDSDDLPAKERREELLKNYDADKAFAAKTVWSRIAIIAAGLESYSSSSYQPPFSCAYRYPSCNINTFAKTSRLILFNYIIQFLKMPLILQNLRKNSRNFLYEIPGHI